MALDYVSATDAILSTLKVQWDADTPAIVGGAAPVLVFDTNEQTLKPNPEDSTKPWARAVVRHGGAQKVTLNNAVGQGRYRRMGLVWVQIYVPFSDGSAYTTAQRLAQVAQKAYEGRRSGGGEVVFTESAIQDRAPEGQWFRYDVKTSFYWDEIK
jgi:hypothetical protein